MSDSKGYQTLSQLVEHINKTAAEHGAPDVGSEIAQVGGPHDAEAKGQVAEKAKAQDVAKTKAEGGQPAAEHAGGTQEDAAMAMKDRLMAASGAEQESSGMQNPEEQLNSSQIAGHPAADEGGEGDKGGAYKSAGDEDLAKQAADCEAAGRLTARGFKSELEENGFYEKMASVIVDAIGGAKAPEAAEKVAEEKAAEAPAQEDSRTKLAAFIDAVSKKAGE